MVSRRGRFLLKFPITITRPSRGCKALSGNLERPVEGLHRSVEFFVHNRTVAKAVKRFSSWVVASAAVSAFGDGLLVAGLPLLAKSLTDDARLVTATFVAGRLPWVLSPFIGAVVDRTGRPKQVMRATDLVRFMVLLATWIALENGSGLAVLFPAAFVLGAGEIAFSAASWSLVRHVTESDNLDKVNSQLSFVQTSGEQLLGPMAGGVIFASARSLPIIGDAATFLASAVLLQGAPDPSPPKKVQTFGAMVSEGLRVVRSTPAIWVTTLWIASISFVHSMQGAVLVLIGEDLLGLKSFWYGAFIASIAAGNVVGSLVVSRILTRFGAFQTLAAATVVAGLAHLAAATSHSALAVTVALAIDGIATVVGTVCAVGVRQRSAPPHLVGSVMATTRMIIYGAAIPGGIIAGFIAEAHGTRPVLAVVGVAILLGAMLGSRRLRRVF
jgi:MFS family permease